MADWDDESARVLALLLRDLGATLGGAPAAECGAYARRRAAELRAFDIGDPSDQLVDDVQQTVHDRFIDTIWPACPRHRSHPLWHRDGAWWCEADGVALARLGELPPRQAAG